MVRRPSPAVHPSIYLTPLAIGFALVGLSLATSSLGRAISDFAELPPHVPGEILIKFRADARDQDRISVQEAYADHVLGTFRGGGLHWRLPPDVSVEEALASLADMEAVEYAEPNAIGTITATPHDEFYTSNQWGPQKIDAESAWDISMGSSSVVIAVLDNGVDRNHPDLSGNTWTKPVECDSDSFDDDGNGLIDDCYGWDFAANDNDPRPNLGNLHGTEVAGILGAAADDTGTPVGIAGINWQVKIMSVRTYNNTLLLNTVVNAIDYAADNGADIINASWNFGCNGSASTCHPSMRDAINRAAQHEVLIVATPGNNNVNADPPSGYYPASFELKNVVSVAATDIDDVRAHFDTSDPNAKSNWGPASVDLSAPGLDVFTTSNDQDGEASWVNFSGTSAAAPHVAGVAGLLRALKPSIPAESIKGLLLQKVDVLPSSSDIGPGKTVTGGRLNAAAAVSNQDTVSPNAITNLSASGSTGTTMNLSWTSSGDTYADGTATFYDVRYSTAVITADNWNTRSLVFDEPTPLVSGTTQGMTVTGLSSGTCYYLAMRGYDEWGNGPTSNMVKCGTRPAMCLTEYCKQVGEVWQRCTFNNTFGSCGCCNYSCVADETCENGEPAPPYACGVYCL